METSEVEAVAPNGARCRVDVGGLEPEEAFSLGFNTGVSFPFSGACGCGDVEGVRSEARRISTTPWEDDEYVVLGLGGPIGPTRHKREALVVASWLRDGGLAGIAERLAVRVRASE